MEVRVFKNGSDWNNQKPLLVQRLFFNDSVSFPYDSTVRTFKALYGSECVIDFIVL